ncbi:hypothetical protein F4802DRAFT_610628 [Xylaria palmicola]|nr:hypothetical protein F4802DRAFT_610628 [Xylaria palmicola]
MEVVQPGLEVLTHQHQHQQYGQNGQQQWEEQQGQKPLPGQLPSYQVDDPSPRKRGWGPAAAIATAITAVVIGATVGGGLGASLSSCKNELGYFSPRGSAVSQCQTLMTATNPIPSSTTTTSPAFPTTTNGLLVNYTVESPGNIENLAADCTSLTSTLQITPFQDKFSVYCYQDFGTGNLKDNDNRDVVVDDVMLLIAYSMADCLQACSQYTRRSQALGIDSSCGAVVWVSDMSHFNHYQDGNCALKNSTVKFGYGNKGCGWCYSATKVN